MLWKVALLLLLLPRTSVSCTLNLDSVSVHHCPFPILALRTQSEVRTLSSLLERSQQESRSLLEKKESLLHAILHLETSNSDLDAVNSEVKKELWRTSNSLNRLQGKYEELQVSSAKMEQKLKNDILELKLEYVALITAQRTPDAVSTVTLYMCVWPMRAVLRWGAVNIHLLCSFGVADCCGCPSALVCARVQTRGAESESGPGADNERASVIQSGPFRVQHFGSDDVDVAHAR